MNKTGSIGEKGFYTVTRANATGGFSRFSVPFFGVKFLYDYGLWL